MAERQKTVAKACLWGMELGTISWDRQEGLGHFSYSQQFRHSGLQVAPVTMPLDDLRFSFPELNEQVFKGLPGLLADALPDKFGNAVIDAWLLQQGLSPGSLNPVEQLCLIADKGMGALEFIPPLVDMPQHHGKPLNLPVLVQLINLILSEGGIPVDRLHDAELAQAMQSLMQIGLSADGSRAKAVVALDADGKNPIEGHRDVPEGYSYWLLKFDGITGNRDREAADPQGWGRVEYAYYLMAREAGIDMMECRLFPENGRQHFITRRFDRTDTGERIHRQSLCAMGHMDFDALGAYSYEEVGQIMRDLKIPQAAIEEHFRRMVFNVLARNHDDHPKNIAFLMDRRGRWRLAPAYDLTFAYNPSGHWTHKHQMTLNSKRDDFTYEDLLAVAARFDMTGAQVREVTQQVQDAVAHWPEMADAAGVPEDMVSAIGADLRPNLL